MNEQIKIQPLGDYKVVPNMDLGAENWFSVHYTNKEIGNKIIDFLDSSNCAKLYPGPIPGLSFVAKVSAVYDRKDVIDAIHAYAAQQGWKHVE
jgi:hypothetical protein